MIEGLKPYAEYKESGLAWLGQIPASWETKRTKTRFRLSMEKSGLNHGKELLSVYTRIGVRPRKDLEQRGNKASSTDDYWVVRQGDIIVNKLLAWMGAVGVSHFDGVTSPAYDILRPIQKLEPDFYHLLFRTKLYLQLFKSRSRGIMDMRLRLYFDQLGQIPLICPPPDQQAAIVRFLDNANRKIDGFIRAKRKLIGLLNEQKQAIIHRAVTRGLHPDVPLKPSDIPWLGNIPQHWEVRRLSTVAQFDSGKAHEQFVDAAGTHICVTARFVSTGGVTRKFCTRNFSPANKGDVLMVMSDLPNGRALARAYLVEDDASYAVNQRVCIIRPRKMVSEFLAYQANRSWGLLQNDDHCNQTHLSNSDYKTLPLLCPPVPEQEEIVRAVHRATQHISPTIARTEREIALMQEYRTRLTADLVTGKLDVREAVAHLPAPSAAELAPDESMEETETDEIEA